MRFQFKTVDLIFCNYYNYTMNYSQKTDKIIEDLITNADKASLLLHSCCAPCSSYVLEYLKTHFDITLLYYNPNIYPKEEYIKRKDEQIRLIKLLKGIKYIDSDYESEKFYSAINGLEKCKEGGARCSVCFELRLEKTAQLAKEGGFAFFGTTLTVSPHKDAVEINRLGSKLSQKYGVKFLYSDFKKKDGYKKSILLSEKFNLYRQNYCGCEFSLKR